MANLITCLRIACSVVLLFCRPFSAVFSVVYIIAGFTDMIDGTVARRTGTASEFGARLDTVADMALVFACLVKLLPVLKLEAWMYIWVAVIAAIKGVNLISGYLLEKKLVAVHSAANKLTGALLFLLPLSLRITGLNTGVVIVCAAATFAAVQEGHYIRTGRAGQHAEVAFRVLELKQKDYFKEET